MSQGVDKLEFVVSGLGMSVGLGVYPSCFESHSFRSFSASQSRKDDFVVQSLGF